MECYLYLGLSLLLLGVSLLTEAEGYVDDYVTSSCRVNFETVFSGRKYILRSWNWPTATTCSMTYRGKGEASFTPERVSVKFLSLHLSCLDGNVDILDSDGTLLGAEICGDITPIFQPFDSKGSQVTIRLNRRSDTHVSPPDGTFEIMVTRFNKDLVCNFDEYSCFNGKCISDSLECDGYDNCGDDSDEDEADCGMTMVMGIYIGLAVMGLGIVIVAIVAVFKRRRNGYIFYSNPKYMGTTAAIVTSSQNNYGAVNPPPAYQPIQSYPPAGIDNKA